MATRTDVLASYTRDSGYGPTRTKTTTRRLEQRLRGVLQRINSAIRRGIVEQDIFGLTEQSDTLEVDDPGPFRTSSGPTTRAKFVQWLKTQLDSEFLTVVGRNRNQYIRRAYSEGIRLATSQLRGDVDLATVDVEELVQQRRFDTGLRTLFRRTYSNLESVTEDVTTAVRDELLEGFEKGENPTKIARRLTDRVDSIGKHRATMIARSETINAHTEGFLDRTEQVSEDLHPHGRCSLQVELGVDEDDLAPLSERVPGTIVT